MKNPTVLIIDVATCNPRAADPNNHLLEICLILVDARTLEPIDTFCGPFKRTEAETAKAFEAHVMSGLVAECHACEISDKGREGFLLAGPWNTASAVCNRQVDWDLEVLKRTMPTFFRSLPKLQVELKAVALLCKAKGVPEYTPSMPRTFRSSDDAILALEELTHWMKTPAVTA